MTDRRCPDAGRCHHRCAVGCWRVTHAGPLSGVYPDNEWPTSVTGPSQDKIDGAVEDVRHILLTTPGLWQFRHAPIPSKVLADQIVRSVIDALEDDHA